MAVEKSAQESEQASTVEWIEQAKLALKHMERVTERISGFNGQDYYDEYGYLSDLFYTAHSLMIAISRAEFAHEWNCFLHLSPKSLKYEQARETVTRINTIMRRAYLAFKGHGDKPAYLLAIKGRLYSYTYALEDKATGKRTTVHDLAALTAIQIDSSLEGIEGESPVLRIMEGPYPFERRYFTDPPRSKETDM